MGADECNCQLTKLIFTCNQLKCYYKQLTWSCRLQMY